MQVASDFIYGAIIAGIVLLIVLSLKLRGEQTSIDATQYRGAKIGTLALVEAIERDFTNIGSHNPNLETLPIGDIFVGWDTTAVPAYLVFQARIDSVQGKTNVCYAWQETAKTVALTTGTKQLITVERKIGTAADCTGGAVDGQSTNMITNFEIHLLRSDSLGITNIYGPSMDLQQILVRLRAVSPLGPGKAIEETRWEKIFRPVNLWERQREV